MQRFPRLIMALGLVLALAVPGLAQTASTGAPQSSKPQVKLETTKGDIVIELYKDKAPLTVANFLANVRKGHYDGTIFHRVINGFMIQGGGFDLNLKEKPTGKPIRNEADNHLKNTLYSVAMARTSDPHSASAQFFINVRDNRSLDHRGKTEDGWGYAVFGEVVDGKRVVDEIKAVRTGSIGMLDDVPLQPVMIKKATIISQ
jgi:peptidyl-prolyl cis-trans isomerase B (cyclophilin B)